VIDAAMVANSNPTSQKPHGPILADNKGMDRLTPNQQHRSTTNGGTTTLASEVGASLVEYILLISLVALIAIPSVRWVGDTTNEVFTQTNLEIQTGGGAVTEGSEECGTPDNPCGG
jgi:Flp pilus assembly pilin Flp